jgi:ATP-dependent Clp protease ATP-binding subunit ClpA
LADEVLFGRLKNGGTVRVIVTGDDDGKKSLGFVYPDGPLLPRPEPVVEQAAKKPARTKRKAKAAKRVADEPTQPRPSSSTSVPKVPLKS